MGRGPFHLVENGALDVVGGILDDVKSIVVEYHSKFLLEIETTFGLHRETAGAVRRSLEQGQFPLLFSGNCSSTVGAMGGFGNRKLALHCSGLMLMAICTRRQLPPRVFLAETAEPRTSKNLIATKKHKRYKKSSGYKPVL